ncbi:MAG: exodeoxyribonuclease VII large subunit [Bacteroidota bacterium]
MESTLRLYELNEFLRRTVALNFPNPVWVKAEIAQFQESRGHYYLTLIEKEGADIIASSDALIWGRDYRRMRRRMGVKLHQILREGMAVMVQVRVEFHERFGMTLSIQEVDGDYSLGQLALNRQLALQQLETEDLLDRNKKMALPPVLQNLAVISSLQAAGYQDYQQQLRENPYGYAFHSRLFPAAVQGSNAVAEVIRQLAQIAGQADRYEAVLILRGGGAKLDLLAFDDLDLARAVAQCPLPVLVGIGHEVDETVLDLVAHRSLKTPTALADFILHHNTLFESQLLQLGQELQRSTQQELRRAELELNHLAQNLGFQSRLQVRRAERLLDFVTQRLVPDLQLRLRSAENHLALLAQRVQLLDPEACLRRGYSITLHRGRALPPAENLSPGAELETRLHGRRIYSKVSRDEKE